MAGFQTILVKILGTRHKIALLQSLIQCPPLPPFQCWLNQTPFDHPNIELGGKGDEKVLNVCFHLDILGIMTKTQKFASVPIYFDQDCRPLFHSAPQWRIQRSLRDCNLLWIALRCDDTRPCFEKNIYNSFWSFYGSSDDSHHR